MDLGVQRFRCQGSDALKQAIHRDNGLAWTDGKGIFLSPVSLFQGQVEPQEHYKLGEFERGVRSVHWSENLGTSLCYLCVVHDRNISLWRVDGQQPKLSFKQVRKINIQPIPQGCVWSPGRDLLAVLCPHQASLYYSHLKNKGSHVLLQLERDRIRCGCWTTDGSKLVVCVGTTLMVYGWSDIDKSITQYSSITWTVPGLHGRISSVVSVSRSRILYTAELPLESLCKQQDTFLLPEVVKTSPHQPLLESQDSDIIKPNGQQHSLTQALLNLPRNPEAVIEDSCRLDCVDLPETGDPAVAFSCHVKGLLTPDTLLYEPDLQTVVVGSNTQSLLQVYSVDQEQISKTHELLLDKTERPKGIACLPTASGSGHQGVLLLVGKTTLSESPFPSSTNEVNMKSMLKFFSVKPGKNGRYGKAPLTHTTSTPAIPVAIANGGPDTRDHERLTYSVINFDTNLQSAQSLNNLPDNSGTGNLNNNRSVSEVNVKINAETKTESQDGKKAERRLEPPKRPVRKKKSLRGKEDLSQIPFKHNGIHNENPKKMAMEYLSDSSETSPRELAMVKQDSVCSESSIHSGENVKSNIIQATDIPTFKEAKSSADINQNTEKTESNIPESKDSEVTIETLKLPDQQESFVPKVTEIGGSSLTNGDLSDERQDCSVPIVVEIGGSNLTNGELSVERKDSSVPKVVEIGGSNFTNGELSVERTEFSLQKPEFRAVDPVSLCAEEAVNRRAVEDVINKKLGIKAAPNKQTSTSLESLDDIDRILQLQNKKISKLQEQMTNLSRRVDESSCVLPTRYQSISKADMVHLCFRCKDGFEIKKRFLLDNGRLKLEEVKHAFSLASLEIQIDGDWCVTGCNIDGYIPVRFEHDTTVYINGCPA